MYFAFHKLFIRTNADITKHNEIVFSRGILVNLVLEKQTVFQLQEQLIENPTRSSVTENLLRNMVLNTLKIFQTQTKYK